MLRPGSTFGRYTVVKLLGQGGMGAVYLVRHNVLDSEFALKVLAQDVEARTGTFVLRFIREAKLSCRIRHPNLVAVYDAGHDEATGLYYLVMDFMPGGTLRDRMLSNPQGMAVGDALRVVDDVAKALVAAAKFGLVHRDIKPENIMFDAQGVARLADLGIAKASGSDDSIVTMANAVFGTPAYMSPEQARDSSKVDARADIYSLGIVLYEMLCGMRPYKEGSPIGVMAQVISEEPIPDIREHRPDIPESVAQLVIDMCEKNVRRRLASASDLHSRIVRLSAESCVVIPTVASKRAPVARGFMRSMAPLTVLLLFVLLVGGIAWWRNSMIRTQPVHQSSPAPVQPDAQPVTRMSATDSKPVASDRPVASDKPVASDRPVVSDRPVASSRPAVPARPVAPVKSVVPPVQTPAVDQSAPSAPPAPPEVLPGSVIVLGDGSDASLAVGRRASAGNAPLAALEAENPAHLMRQIDEVIAKNPKHVYLKLADSAEARGISPENFEVSLFAVADRLREKNVPFTCVIDPDTEDNARYNAAVREVCKLRSYECSQSDGK